MRPLLIRMLPLLLLGSACREEPTTTLHFQVTQPAAEKVRLAVMADASTRGGSAPARAKPEPESRRASPAPAEKPRTGAGAGTGTSECKIAADCVVEPADCCNCANGGKQHAIPRARAAASRAAREKRCRDVMCTMMYSTDPSCGKRAGCVDHRCVLISADGK